MRLSCFHCHRPITITTDQLGSEFVCPHCQGVIRLPEAEAEDADSSSAGSGGSGSWLSNSISGLVSCALHLTLMLIFAFINCDYRGGGGGEGEEVLIGELPSVDLNDNQVDQLDASQAEATVEEAEQLDDTLEIITPTETSDGDQSLDIQLTDLVPSGAGGGGAMAAMGTLSGGGGSLGEGASFMGLHAKGSRFCIIADRSGSMDGPKLDFLKEEIIETLLTMRGRGRFQLVFFNSRELPYPQSGWRDPKRERVDVANWLQTVTAEGGTFPTPAFRVAFSLSPRPDAIFFMTDGQFPDSVVADVAQLNSQEGKRVPIHTISFMDTSAAPLMQQIARDSGGKYRHVSGF